MKPISFFAIPFCIALTIFVGCDGASVMEPEAVSTPDFLSRADMDMIRETLTVGHAILLEKDKEDFTQEEQEAAINVGIMPSGKYYFLIVPMEMKTSLSKVAEKPACVWSEETDPNWDGLGTCLVSNCNGDVDRIESQGNGWYYFYC